MGKCWFVYKDAENLTIIKWFVFFFENFIIESENRTLYSKNTIRDYSGFANYADDNDL